MTEEMPRKGPSRAGRLWGLIALSVLLVLPLMAISGLVWERESYRDQAAREIAQSWGGPQVLTGPLLVIPVETERRVERRAPNGAYESQTERQAAEPLILLPERLSIDTAFETETRSYGIHEVPVYRADHRLSFAFDTSEAGGWLAKGEIPLWEQAYLAFGISEPRGLRSSLDLMVGDRKLTFEPGTGLASLRGIQAALGDPRELGAMGVDVALNGSGAIRYTPAGRVTEVSLAGDWAHPSFAGSFLPLTREIGPDGTKATWEVPHLARSVPQVLRDPNSVGGLRASSFGMTLFQPVDVYTKVERAVKHGILFVALTFASLFLLERFASRPTHVAQYALIGAAQCVFFLLVLALAEQIGFETAYLLATGATAALLTFYACTALGLGMRGLWFTGALGTLYGVLYLILSSEDQALLAGSLLSFVALAVTMWATRNEDWGSAIGSIRLRRPRAREKAAEA